MTFAITGPPQQHLLRVSTAERAPAGENIWLQQKKEGCCRNKKRIKITNENKIRINADKE
jgi:hypothetical protein